MTHSRGVFFKLRFHERFIEVMVSLDIGEAIDFECVFRVEGMVVEGANGQIRVICIPKFHKKETREKKVKKFFSSFNIEAHTLYSFQLSRPRA